jgi:hypothetical protein
LKLVVCKIGRLHLGKSKLSASTRRFQNLGWDNAELEVYSNQSMR